MQMDFQNLEPKAKVLVTIFFFFFEKEKKLKRKIKNKIAGVYLIPLNLPQEERFKKENWLTLSIVPKTTTSEVPEDLEVNFVTNLACILDKVVKDLNTIYDGIFILCCLKN